MKTALPVDVLFSVDQISYLLIWHGRKYDHNFNKTNNSFCILNSKSIGIYDRGDS